MGNAILRLPTRRQIRRIVLSRTGGKNITPEIASAFDKLSPENRAILKSVRHLVSDLAAGNPQIGPLTETLKWSEPAYLTEATKAGSTIRRGQTRPDSKPAFFVNCQTTLIEEFRQLYPETFEYRDNRALVLLSNLDEVIEPLRHCIALALTYHARKRGMQIE